MLFSTALEILSAVVGYHESWDDQFGRKFLTRFLAVSPFAGLLLQLNSWLVNILNHNPSPDGRLVNY